MAVGLGETKLRILERLRAREACTSELAMELGISRVAVHRHLEGLIHEGLVRSKQNKTTGRGRPRQVFLAVDEEAPYARMCGDVLSHIKALFGAGAVLSVLSSRNAQLQGELAPRLTQLPLEQRLAELADFLTEHGYQAQVYREGKDWYLVQERCPKLALALEHSEFCSSEIELYQQLLGLQVVREDRIAAGGDCCRYRISAEDLR
ncbi:MAG: ArsR family transcriptional regulator [Deinococcus sp.]|nr:ArsR family transcriptional regulator [Deinococcus sp.]